MKTMAILNEKNIVLNIIVVDNNELETATKITYTNKNPAYIDGDYYEGYFYAVQPYASWTRNKGVWVSPIPYPNNDENYSWNEQTQTWDLNG
jgi:hypothetical protein